ncbi:MAG: HTH-type transcriptional repressor CarH [Planctomycetota bacterium]|nr:MAG: HTH-type transcriptional repressor CarH [Planctomycetota bacterium]
MTVESQSAEPSLSVGRVAKATGISVDTLRMWERRYGTPVPVRLPSGHRRYTEEQLRRLRRVSEALSRGHRAGSLLQLEDAELDELLSEPTPEPVVDTELRAWLTHASRLDDIALRDALRDSLVDANPMRWISERAAPFLRLVGRAWADGEIHVRHEHLAAEVLEEVLLEQRAELLERIPQRELGPVVITTLPGEEHGLGLSMVAVFCAALGVPSRRLGVQTPLEDIAGAAEELDARAVALSVSLSSGGVGTDRVLAKLRDLLPDGCEVIVGGEGVRGPRRGPRGVRLLRTSAKLARWLRALD